MCASSDMSWDKREVLYFNNRTIIFYEEIQQKW